MLYGLIAHFIAEIIGKTFVPFGTKIAAPLTGEIVFLFFRFIITTFTLFIIIIILRKTKFEIHNIKSHAILGVILSANIILFTYGIQHTTLIMSSLIYSLTPLFVGVAGHLFLNEQLSKKNLMGLLISFSGLIILLSNSLKGLNDNAYGEPIGNTLIFIAMSAYSYYLFYSRKILKAEKSSPILTTFWTFVFITAYMSLIFFTALFTSNIAISNIPQGGILGFFIVGFFSALQYYLLQIGVKRTTAFISSLFHYLGPLITASLSIPLLGEQITSFLVIGGILILAGVFLNTSRNSASAK